MDIPVFSITDGTSRNIRFSATMNICRLFSFSLITAFCGFSAGLTPLAASSSTADLALQATEMLRAERWAQAVRIENTNRTSRYPETVYGTVFEFNEVLWFYTATGTQPLKTSKNRTDDFKDNLLPLLRKIDRGFTSFQVLSPPGDDRFAPYPSLKNGCVIESIFCMDELAQNGEPILEAKLLLYTSKNPTRSSSTKATGHCVLVYRTPSGMFYIDPPTIQATGTLKRVREWDPHGIAAEIESHYGEIKIEKAFFEEFALPIQRLARAS